MRQGQNRRRGRGGQRPPQQGGSVGRGPEMANRDQHRNRGNAAQLLEKYRNLARDSQLQGDRITAEYYLQYADHYYRVLNENRPRFDDNRRRDWQDRDERYSERDESDPADDGGDDDAPEALNGERRFDERDRRGNQQRGRYQDQPRDDEGDRPQRRYQDTQPRDDSGERSQRGRHQEAAREDDGGERQQGRYQDAPARADDGDDRGDRRERGFGRVRGQDNRRDAAPDREGGQRERRPNGSYRDDRRAGADDEPSGEAIAAVLPPAFNNRTGDDEEPTPRREERSPGRLGLGGPRRAKPEAVPAAEPAEASEPESDAPRPRRRRTTRPKPDAGSGPELRLEDV
ncbi:MAG: DUF4167 domain-containing protein [Sphingomonadaceae bacterium]|nr:DUF4167 domain-containing protein [Sphingomonadaceae bacterium]